MVEENFKIGINLELEQSSLADLEKQIERTIKNATQKAFKNVNMSAVGPSTGAVKAAGAATGVKGSDFPKAIQSAMSSGLKSFEQSIAQMNKTMDRLASALEKDARSGPAKISPTTATGGPRKPDLATGTERAQKEVAKRITALRAQSRAGGGDSGLEAKIQKEKKKFEKITSQRTRLAKKSAELEKRSAAIDQKLLAVKEEEAAVRKQFIARMKGENRGLGGSAVSAPRDPRKFTKERVTVGGTQQNQKAQSVARSQTAREQSAPALVTPKNQPHRTGDGPTDNRGNLRAAGKIMQKAAGGPPRPPEKPRVDYMKQAQQDIANAAKTFEQVAQNIVKHMPQYKGKDLKSIFNLPGASDMQVRQGAAPTIKSPSGKERHLGSVVKITGDVVTRLDRISHSFEGHEAALRRIADASRRRPGSEVNAVQALIRKRSFGGAPMYEGHQSMGSFVKAGESKMIFEPGQKQAAKIMGKGDAGRIDAAKLGEVEATFHDMAKMGQNFVKAGVDVISMLGLTEESAAAMAKAETNWALKLNKATGQFEGTITGKMQTRPIQQFQAGGPGFGKQARSSFMKGFAKIEGGQAPVVQSPFYREMLKKGNITGSARNLKTAAVSARQVPEVHEDQSLITFKAAKAMGMSKEKTKLLKTPAEDLMVGSNIQDKQAMGVNAAGKKVVMALNGTAAVITKMVQVTKQGVQMMAITYDEFNAPGTGMKGSTMPGNKSMFKAVSEDYMRKLGVPKGTEVVTSIEGMARRGDTQDPAIMIATSMAEGGKESAQMIFDSITGAMKAGSDMLEGAMQAGAQFGIDPNVAMKSTSGALAAGGIDKVLTGTLPWHRMEKEGMTGPADQKDRFIDPVSISALSQRQETLAYAMAAQEKAHHMVTKEQKDYHNVLLSMTGATENVTAGLKKMKPEEFKRMPRNTVSPEDMMGTIVDKDKMKGAFNMQMPKFGGGFEDFYMPAIGSAVGQRGARDTEEGLSQASDLSKAFENFRQSGVEIKAARGELDPRESKEVQQEGAEFANRQMQQQIEKMGGAKGAEGKQLAKQFVDTWMPVVKMMDQAGIKAGIAWKKMSTTGKETVQTFRGSPSAYAKLGKGDSQKANRIRDMLALRASGDPKASRQKGVVSTAAIGSAGAIFKDIEILDAVLKKLGKTAAEDASHMGKLWSKLEEGRAVLLDRISEQGFGKAGTPGREELRKVASTRGSGLAAGSQYAKAMEYNVDISSELKSAEKQLRAIGKAGGDVGEALSALNRIKALNVSEDILPRDAMLLSKTDYAAMKAAVKKEGKLSGEDLSDKDVSARMKRGIMARYPITGGESHQVTKFLEDKAGKLPEGKVGIPGVFAASSTKDLEAMRGPLEAFRESLIGIISTNNGFGAAAEGARAKLKDLNPTLDALTQTFHKSTTNLDFDGDNIIQHAANSKEAANKMRTSVEVLKSFGFSLQNAQRTILGNIEGPDQDFQSLEGINKSFGALAKGRPAGLGARPAPDTAETARTEAMGLVGGKLSVGLLSDAFNLFHQAVVGGSKLTGDAFATAKDLIMLNINKSLAAKHGGGDTAGPLGLLDEIKKGPEGLKNIFKGMDAGGPGVLGDMGKMNKQMREKMGQMLPAMDTGDLMEMGIKEGILAEGEKLTPANFKSVIDQLMDKMDLKGQMQNIWNRIEANLRESLTKRGLSSSDINKSIEKMTSPDEKGDIKGVNLRSLTSDAFQISKKMGAKELRGMTTMERAGKVLDANFEDIKADPSKPKKLSSDLQSWLDGVLQMVGILSDADIKGMGRDPKDVGGMYMEGPPGSTPGQGAVMVGETSRVSPLKTSIDAIAKMETGQIRKLPDIIDMATRSIERMKSTVGHERVHAALKVPGTSGAEAKKQISTQLMEGSGMIGANRDAIREAARKLPSIETKETKYEALKTAGAPSDEIAKQGKKYMDAVAEEVLAHLTNPSRWMEIFGKIPAEVGMVFVKMFGKMKSEMPDLLGPLEATSKELMSRVQALKQGGTPQAADVRGEAQARIAGHGPLRARGRMVEEMEGILSEGRVAHGLTPGTREGLRTRTEGAVSFPLEGREGLDSSAKGMRLMLKQMGEGAGVGGTDLEALRGRFQETAQGYKETVSKIPKKEGGGFQEGNKAYIKAMQEFQAAEVQMYLNQAKKLQHAADELASGGMADSAQFNEVIANLDSVLERLMNNMMKIKIGGKMKGLATAPDGGLTDRAFDIGIRPSKDMYADVAKRHAPSRDPAARKDFMESGVGAQMMGVLDNIKEGESRTQQWIEIWDELVKKPKELENNLGVVADILKDFGGTMIADMGPNNPATKNIQAMAKTAKEAHKALQDMPQRIETKEDAQIAAAKIPAVRKAAFGGRNLASMIEKQEKGIEAARQKWENALNEMHKQGVTPAGGRNIESGKTFDVTGPDNIAIKKFGMTAKRGMDGYKVSLHDATKAQGQLSGSIRNSLRRVVQWGFATGIVYGTIRAFRTMIQTITEVETKMTALKKVMDTSITNFEKMQDAATGFAQEFGVAIEDVLDGMVVYGQQGLKVNKIMERTRATMLAVNVTTLSSVEATEALTAAHKVFGSAMDSSTGFVDAWAAVAAKHAITAKDLADAVKRSGAAAEVAGVGFNDFLGIVTAIGAVTRQTGKEIATSTKFMFRAMRRPTAQKELGKMGVSSMTAGGDFRPAVDIMKELAGSWDGLTRAQQVNLAQAMAGIRHYNSFIVLMNNFDEALLASADAANSQGFAMRKNRLSMATFAKQMTVMKESTKGLVLELGKSALGPATALIKTISAMVQGISKLPPALLKGTLMVTGMGLAFHKLADFIADAMDAMSSTTVTNMGGGAGRAFGGSKMFEKMKGGISSIGRGFAAAGGGGMVIEGVGGATSGLGKLGTVAKGARKALMGVGSRVVMLATWLPNLIPPLKGVVAGMRAMSAAAMTTIGGAVIAAAVISLMMLHSAYQKATQSAKEFEHSQEDIIGKSEDAASSLRGQLVTADRLTLSYKKIGTAMDAMSDASGMAAALTEGRFKGAATAAQKYSDLLAEVGNKIAQADPTKVTGISDTGDLIVGIEDNFKSLTQAALDAQNAVSVALKASVISAYSKELGKTISIWDSIAESINRAQNAAMGMFGGQKGNLQTDMSALGDLKQTNMEIKKITDARKKQAAEGGYQIAGQAKLIELVQRRAQEEMKVLEIAEQVRRVFESMPVFGDIDAAMKEMTPKLQGDLKIAIETGEFGRGATLESVMTQFMGKQAGLGGIMDYKNTQSAGLTANAFLERGIQAQSGAGAAAGVTETDQIGLLSKNAADLLTKGVQTLFSTFDSATGDIVFQYRDIEGEMQRVTSEAIEEAGRTLGQRQGEVADQFITWTKKEVDAAAEGTRRLLTTQFTGALAGIRIPSGGMPTLGPSRSAELTLEQRIMKSLPEDIQRLSDVQKEYNALGKEYSEVVLGDVKGAYIGAGKASQALKVATQDVLELAVRLQKEGFQLSVIANYEKMQHKLNQTLEQAARAAEDYESAERNKNRYITSPAGAMAGLGATPQLDLGKAFKELTALDKLRIETPGFGSVMSGVKSRTDKRDRDVGTLDELEKQLKDFDEAVRDMGIAGSEMEAEGNAKVLTALREGASKGQRAMIRSMNEDAIKQLDVATTQLGVQRMMLDELGFLAELLATPEDKRQDMFTEKIRSTDYDSLTKAYGKIFKSEEANALQRSVLGLRENSEGEMEIGKALESANTAELDAIVRLMNAIIDRDKEMTSQKILGEDGRIKPGITDTGVTEKIPGLFNNKWFVDIDAAQKELGERIKKVFTSSGISMKALENEIINRASDPKRRKAAQLTEIAKANAKITEARIKAEKAENAVRKSINSKIADLKAELDKGNSEISKISKDIRIAQSARDLATSLKDMVKEFKRAEAAVVIKLKSDLEGPFARVGKPGFKTDFDKRREELKSGANRPMSLGAMRERDKARKQLRFDEKEAKIQQKQAIETAALKRQQSRAEQVRTKMQDIMDDPDQDRGVRASAKSFFDTLGDELAVSEQADKRGDKLFFKGIPSLDNLSGLADEIKATANKRVRDLKQMEMVKANAPLLEEMRRETKIATDQLTSLLNIEASLTGGTIRDTGGVSLGDLGAVGTGPGGADHSQTASTRRPATTSSGTRGAGAAAAGVGSADALSTSEWVKALKDASRMQQEGILGKTGTAAETSDSRLERILQGARDAGIGHIAPKEAGMGGGILTALGTLAKGTSPAVGSAASIKTPMGVVTNTVQKIGDDLVVAASHLDGQVVGLQEFDVVHGDGGAKSLRARHIGGETGTGLELPDKMQGHGVGSNRLAKVMEYGQAEGFSALESTESVKVEQARAYNSAAKKTGLTAINNLQGAPDSPALKVPLKPQGIMDKVGNFRAGQEGAFTGSKWLKGGKVLGAAGGGLEAYQMASTMIGAESAQTPEELNKFGGQLAGQTLGFGGVAAMSAAGGMAFGAPGAIGMGLLGGAGMVADQVTGAGSLDYAGQYWNEKSGGMFSSAAQMGGKALMAPGNLAGDAMDWWNTRGVDMGSGEPTAGATPGQRAMMSELSAPSDASMYAALGMPDQLTGAAAPGGATPAATVPDLYSEEQMRWEGGTGGKGKNKQWFGSASNRTGRTLIPEDILAGGAGRGDNEALDLNEYIQRMQDTRAAKQVGASNNRQQNNIIAQNDHTQSVSPAAATPDQREAAQRVSSETRRSESGGGNEELASAIDSLNSKLDGLTDIKIDTSEITTAIGVSTTEIVGALGSELSVSISSSVPLDVNVISQPAGTAADAASAGGPDVTVLAADLLNLTGIQDIQKTDIAALTTRVTTGETTDDTQNTNISQLQTDTKGLDSVTINTSITTQINEAQATIQGQVTDAIGVVDGKVSVNTTAVTAAQTTADEAKTTAEGFKDAIIAASDTAIDAKNTADETKVLAGETKVVADNAATVANAAQSEAAKAKVAVDKINGVVDSNRQKAISETGIVKGVVDTNKTVGKANATAIRKLQTDLSTVRGTADSANAKVNR